MLGGNLEVKEKREKIKRKREGRSKEKRGTRSFPSR